MKSRCLLKSKMIRKKLVRKYKVIEMKKKIQYSKIITSLTFVLFVVCIVKCMFTDISTVYDISLYATIITTTGALCLTSVVWYLKNSQAEKVANIKAGSYRTISEERYKFNEKMLALKAQYKYAEEDIFEIENDNPLDELEQEAMESMNASIDNAMDDATSLLEAQDVG